MNVLKYVLKIYNSYVFARDGDRILIYICLLQKEYHMKADACSFVSLLQHYLFDTLIYMVVIPIGALSLCDAAYDHDDVIKWKHFPRYWPFERGIHRSPMNSSHKGQWRGALMLSLIWVWMNASINNLDAGDLIRHRAHYDVIVM